MAHFNANFAFKLSQLCDCEKEVKFDWCNDFTIFSTFCLAYLCLYWCFFFFEAAVKFAFLIFCLCLYSAMSNAVWPDRVIFWTLGNFLKPLATILLPNSLTFLGNFCKGVKINHFYSEIIFGQLLDIWQFFSGHTVHVAHHLVEARLRKNLISLTTSNKRTSKKKFRIKPTRSTKECKKSTKFNSNSAKTDCCGISLKNVISDKMTKSEA